MSDASIEAMKAQHLLVNGPTKTMLIINDPANIVNGCGGLLENEEVTPEEVGPTIETARLFVAAYWDALGCKEPRPEMWLQREWPWGRTEYIAPPAIKSRGRSGQKDKAAT